MEDSLEGFLNILKKKLLYENVKFPNKITKNNVNDVAYENPYTGRQLTILDIVIQNDVTTNSFGEVISILLELGAIISSNCLTYSQRIRFPLLFDYGADPNMKLCYPDYSLLELLSIDSIDECILAIDYGAKIPKDWDKERTKLRGAIIEYAHLSNRRVQECKRCLLAIAYVCNISPFRPVGEILLSAARQVWAMRGGEGVGPRGHNWIKKN